MVFYGDREKIMKRILRAFLIVLTAGAAAVATAACSDAHEHEYSKRWSYDETYHWHAAICEHDAEKADMGKHDFITVNGKVRCSVCPFGCDHEYEETLIAPTCEADGYTLYTCKICGDSFTKLPTDALGHNFEYTTETEPTSESGGKVKGVCKNDNSHTVEISLPALNATDYTVTEKAPTCDTDGRFSYRYALPGGSVTYTVTRPMLGHKYVDGICSVCKDNENFIVRITDQNTCTVTGYLGLENNVTIPKTIRNRTVTAVGANAFANHYDLESVTVPDTVTAINAFAFNNCRKLKEINLQMQDVRVDATALSGCSSLKKAVIPNHVSAIDALPKENLEEITIRKNVAVRTIPSSAFENCTRLERVTLPENLTTISGSAFKNCYHLMSVTIPASVTDIRENAFLNCYKLAEVYNFSNLAITPNSDTNAYGKLGCYAKFIFTEEHETVYRETDDGFIYFSENDVNYLTHYKGADTEVTLPNLIDGETYRICPYAFYGRTDIRNVTLQSGVTQIGENAFYGCFRLAEVYNFSTLSVGRNSENGCVGNYAYVIHSKNEDSAISVQDDFEFIYDDVAEEYQLLRYTGTDKQIVLPASHKGEPYRVGKYAFHNYTELTKITVPDSVRSFAPYAFWNCGAEIVFDGTPSFTEIGEYAFYGYAGKKFNLPASVTKIGGYAFAECGALKELYLPREVREIGATAFYNCSELEKVYYAGTIAEWCKIAFGTDTSGKTPTSYANPMRYAKSFYANGGKNELTKITVPSNVTAIGAWQFTGFENVTEISFSSSNSVTSIGTGAFSGCTKITSFAVPKNATLGERILAGCISLKTLSMPTSSLKGEKANGYPVGYLFGEEEFAESYTVRQAIPSEEAAAAYWIPRALTEIVLTDASATTVSSNAFINCSHIQTVRIPQNISLIGSYAFFKCSDLTDIYYGGTREEWNAVTKETRWNDQAGNFKVHCTDGDI